MPQAIAFPRMTWRPIQDPALSPAEAELVRLRLAAILAGWADTPYRPGDRCPGAQGGVDCVRFVAAVLDALYGYERTGATTLPQDAALHDRDGAFRTMRLLRRLYAPNVIVTDWSLEPGDMVVTGQLGGAPGHGMIVGAEENHVWESSASGVHRTGVGLLIPVFRVYRQADRRRWLREVA